MKIFKTAFMLASLMTPLTAQWAQYHTPAIPRTPNGKANLAAPAPRTAAGKPDLSGLWEVVVDVEGRTTADIKPADVQPWAQALIQQRTENFGRDNPHYKCLPQGPIYTTAGGFKRFIQTPAMMVILNDDLTYRQIFTDGRALEGDSNPSWMGYSVGHWEGDTLVVESNGFNNRTWLMGYRPHTESLRITERFPRPDFGVRTVAHQPCPVVESVALHYQRVSFPVAYRISHPTRIGIALQGAAVRENLTVCEIVVQDDHHRRSLNEPLEPTGGSVDGALGQTLV